PPASVADHAQRIERGERRIIRPTPVIISLLTISARPFAMKHAAHNSLFHLRQNYPPPAPTAALPSRRL
ncbi:hypothetical protein ACLBV0_15340, partial [Pseudomonas aeruginosa]|uniref:hypothetical protein n=1 Tax=Pseudomonas aeruginosa TaxID=287 RepID=UPI00396A69D1